jgi:hypothetical protein
LEDDMTTGPSRSFDGDPDDQSTTEQLAGQTREKAQELAGQAQAQAQQVTGQARNRLRDQLDQRSSQAAEQIATQASDLRSVSDTLREQGKEGPASAADKLAQYADRVGGYLRDHDSDTLLSDAEDLGRRQPWAVVAGGVALGFAAARFLKASSSHRYASRSAPGSARAGGPSSSPVPATSPATVPGAAPRPAPASSPRTVSSPAPATPRTFAPDAEPRPSVDPTPVPTRGL